MNPRRTNGAGGRAWLPAALGAASLLGLAWIPASGLVPREAGAAPAGARTADSVVVTFREGTNLAIALSPDGSSLALDLQGTLWTLPAAGGAARRETDHFSDVRQPHWSPDGRRIVFQSYRDGYWHLWVTEPGGGEPRQLTSGPHDHREPHWSPDGRRIAFSSDRSGNYDVWQLELETGEIRQLTRDAANDFAPAWSPDGSEVAFVSDRRSGPGIWSRGADGSERLLARAEGRLAGPSWSPDGSRLVYQRVDGGEAGLYLLELGGAATRDAAGAQDGERADPRQISAAGEDVFPFRAAWPSAREVLYTADGRIKRRSVSGGAAGEVPFTAQVTLVRDSYPRRVPSLDSPGPHPVLGILSPAVSPRGDRVAFGALGDLWMLNVGQPAPERLTRDAYVELDPTWSPDGARLAFVSDRAGTMDIWVRDVRTGEERRATTLPGDEQAPAWSPDGARIAFLDEEDHVRVVEVATGAVRTLYDAGSASSRPTWSGDGRTIASSVLVPYSSRYREGTFEILLIPVDGGQPRTREATPHVSVATRGATSPLWSPDGTRMALIMGGVLWVQPVRRDGQPEGPPRRVTSELASSPSWTGDSRSLVFLGSSGLKRVSLDDGSIEPIPLQLTWRRQPPAERTVLHAGRLFDGRSPETRRNVDVVIEGRRIVAVEPHRAANHSGRVVDASRYTVMPGLIESHMHQGTSEAMGRTWLAYGITTVREVSSDPVEALERREAIESGARLGPRIFFTGSSMDGPRIFRPTVSIDGGPQLEMEMDRARELGYDLIKTYVRLPDRMQARIVRLAHEQGIPVTSHELFPAVAFGVDGVEHYTFTSRRGYSSKASLLMNEYQDVRELLIRSGVQWTPTLTVQGGWQLLLARDPAPFLDDPRFAALYPAYVVEGTRAQAARARARRAELEQTMGNIKRSVKAVFDGGGRIIAGTDVAPYAVTLHGELELLVETGMTPYQALRSATLLAAEGLAVADHLGTVEPGKLADLVAVEGNPLSNIRDTRRLRLVVRDGRVHELEALLRRP